MVLPLDMCVGIALAKIRNKLVVVRKVLIELSCPVRNCGACENSTCWFSASQPVYTRMVWSP